MDENLLSRYNEIDWNKLLRQDLGKHSLEESKKDLDEINSIFDDIFAYTKSNTIPQQYIDIINSTLQGWLNVCNEIIHFGDTSQRQLHIEEIRNYKFSIFQNLSAIITYIQAFDSNKDTQLKEITDTYKEKIKQLDEELIKAQNLLEGAQQTATKRKISEYGNFFGNEATKNNETAENNFRSMLKSIVATGIVAIVIFYSVNFVSSDNGIFSDIFNTINSQNILIKFVVISLGVFLIAHFSKVHAAEKHLYNINIQKQNALESHNQILNSVIATESENEKEIRNAILLELTKAMFDAKDTGYLKGGSQNSMPNNSIIEISKTISK